MKREPQDDILLRSYLLGELREEETERLEQRLLQEDELFDLAEAVEADLLAAAARGDLAPEERKRVLQRLASSPQGRKRLALARSLNDEAVMNATVAVPVVVPFRRRAPLPVVRWAALAASLLVTLAGLSWFAWQRAPEAQYLIARIVAQWSGHDVQEDAPPVPPVPSQQSREEKKAERKTVEPTPKPGPRSVAPPVDVLALTLGSLRGAAEEVAKLHLSPGHMAELQIDMEGRDAKSFAVVIHREEEEKTIWEEKALELTEMSGGPMLVVHVPAEKLSAGRYEIAVTPKGESEEMAESQVFQVVKKKH